MAYTKYSLTPANNTAAPPDGAPEGMLPSAVNDTMRDMMAQIRDCGDGIRDGTYTMTAPKITGGTITGAAFTGNTFTSPVISGGTINNATIGATTATTGKFTTLEATGVATFSAGTVSLPAITTTGDTNTGIFFPAADTIAFTEGGVEAMRIDSSGNVGIGTTSSGSPLDVQCNAAALGMRLRGRSDNISVLRFVSNDGSTNYGQLDVRSTEFLIRAVANIPMSFYTNDTERMRITSAGDVGIGTSSPSEKLEINNGNLAVGNAGNNFTMKVSRTGANASSVVVGAFTNEPDIQWTYTGSGALRFTDSTASAERMRIDSSGNVGIGTSSPQASLHVAGAIANAPTGSGVLAGIQSDYAVIHLNGSASTGSIIDFSQSGTDYLGRILYDNTSNYMTFATNTAERMRITSGGEVYIAGTADQGAYNLQCNGTGVWGAGAYVNGSDERIKDNITPLDSGLDVVAKLNPVTYKYKEDWSKDQSTQTGFIAQELLTALEGKNYVDGIVQQGGQYMSVAYQNIIPILTKAIQELKAELDSVKAELQTLKGN